MPIDHSFYGRPIEYGFVDLHISDDIAWTPEMLKVAEQNQEMCLKSMAKRMPHRYWIKEGEE